MALLITLIKVVLSLIIKRFVGSSTVESEGNVADSERQLMKYDYSSY